MARKQPKITLEIRIVLLSPVIVHAQANTTAQHMFTWVRMLFHSYPVLLRIIWAMSIRQWCMKWLWFQLTVQALSNAHFCSWENVLLMMQGSSSWRQLLL